ncbi:Ger(x)C family spore germination protein [Gottfriedia sp. NPDC056225]|uniref:Ger(x)C family spore germination protein n=1 Tax=Gottfriedia sp. NPDC056225 TaxID=3345751 RepID=UPI0035DCEFDB
MKSLKIATISVFILILLTGCKETINIEDITMGLIFGIDTNNPQQKKLQIFMSSPVFSEEAKEKNEQIMVDASSIREARTLFDSKVNGVTTAGKLQALLVGTKLTEQKNWTSILDFLYREPKLRQNADLVFFDGNVSELLKLKEEDKPRLSIFIPQLIETADFRNVTLRTSLRMFHQMSYEKGITPYLPKMSIKDEELEVSGIVLLDKNFFVKQTLSIEETQLFSLLQGKLKGQLGIMASIKEVRDKNQLFNIQRASYSIRKIKRKVDCNFNHNQFDFEISYKIPVTVSQSPIKLNNKTVGRLRKEIESTLEKDLNGLVHKFQANEVDPLGLGILASSYQHEHWKKVKSNWPKDFKNSKIHVKAKIIIVDKGLTM